MKINPPIVLTTTLLLFMAGAGSLSAWFGYTMGHEALKGVTQPDVSPSRKLTQTDSTESSNGTSKEPRILLDEKELIQQAEAIIKGRVSPPPEPPSKPDAEASVAPEPEAEPQAQLVNHSGNFSPIQGSDRDVTLAVMNTAEKDGNYLLDVSLKNNGDDEIRFLYSFLDIRNDQGRLVDASTENLPTELPANGEWFSGIVSIPITRLEDTQKLSLTLTDYPDQQLELSLAEIPVQY